MLNLYAQICFLCVYAHISNISVYILDKYTCTLRHIMFIFTLMSIDFIHEEWDCTLEGLHIGRTQPRHVLKHIFMRVQWKNQLSDVYKITSSDQPTSC